MHLRGLPVPTTLLASTEGGDSEPIPVLLAGLLGDPHVHPAPADDGVQRGVQLRNQPPLPGVVRAESAEAEVVSFQEE